MLASRTGRACSVRSIAWHVSGVLRARLVLVARVCVNSWACCPPAAACSVLVLLTRALHVVAGIAGNPFAVVVACATAILSIAAACEVTLFACFVACGSAAASDFVLYRGARQRWTDVAFQDVCSA